MKAVILLAALAGANARKLMQGPKTQQAITTIGELNQVDGAKPYPYDSWPQTPKVQVTTGSDAENTVQQIEATLSPQQMQQFQALQQQQGRHLLQGPKTQQAITTIGELNQVDGAKPYPYDSWPETPKVQVTTGSDAQNTVQQIEATLSPQQMQQFQALQQQQQQ